MKYEYKREWVNCQDCLYGGVEVSKCWHPSGVIRFDYPWCGISIKREQRIMNIAEYNKRRLFPRKKPGTKTKSQLYKSRWEQANRIYKQAEDRKP